jgi:hypothetical protein
LTTHPAAFSPSPSEDDDPLNPNNDDRLFKGSDDDDTASEAHDDLPQIHQPLSEQTITELSETLKKLASFSQQIKQTQAETNPEAEDEDSEAEEDDIITFPIHYFTLDEAAAMLPMVQQLLKQAHRELKVAYDEVVLYKRLHTLRYIEREASHEDTESILEAKLNQFEATQQRWLTQFASHGVLLRDLQRGVCEFPYKSTTGDEYLLCWKLTDDGIFYFREPNDHPKHRTPISLLPD